MTISPPPSASGIPCSHLPTSRPATACSQPDRPRSVMPSPGPEHEPGESTPGVLGPGPSSRHSRSECGPSDAEGPSDNWLFHLALDQRGSSPASRRQPTAPTPVGAGPCRLAGRNRGASLALTRNEDYQDQVVGPSRCTRVRDLGHGSAGKEFPKRGCPSECSSQRVTQGRTCLSEDGATTSRGRGSVRRDTGTGPAPDASQREGRPRTTRRLYRDAGCTARE
jgi:hypothetical protein